MRRPLLLAPIALTACAKLLSYDDYRARDEGADSGIVVDAAEDSATDANDGGTMPARVPARPAGSTAPSGKGKTLWLAARRFKLGSVDLSGAGNDTDAWKPLGFDLDGLCTSVEDSKLNIFTCMRPMGAQTDSLVDGDDCRDNNFGHHVGTLLRGAAPVAEPGMNDAIEKGSRTWILRIDDVDVGDDGHAPGILYDARDERSTMAKILWDGTDVRTALDDSVLDRDLGKPITTFPNAYISGDSWVSNDPAKMDLFLPISGDYTVPVHLVHGSIVLQLDAARESGHSGVVAGVLPLPAVEDILRPVASFGGFCPGTPIYMAALTSAARGLDVSLDAPNLQDTTKTCDGLSFAVGFDMRPIQPVTAVDTAPSPVDPCAPATDAGPADTGSPDTGSADTGSTDAGSADSADAKSD